MRPWAALALVCALIPACRKHEGTPGSAPSTSASSSASALGTMSYGGDGSSLPPFERFLDVHTRDDGDLDVAGITRARTLVVARVALVPTGANDGELGLRARGVHVLADDVEALAETSVALAAGGLVVLQAKVGGSAGTWMVGTSLPTPQEVGDEWCEVGGGVAWLSREATGARVHFLRAGGTSATSEVVPAAADAEVHLTCGKTAVVVSLKDGEDLTIARLHPDAKSFTDPPVLIPIEHENELPDELRDRWVLPRDGDDVVVVRIGEREIALRELLAASSTPTAWTVVSHTKPTGEPGKRWKLDPDAVVIDVAAASAAGGLTWILASEPMRSAKACKSGDAPMRVVLHTLRFDAKSGAPIVLDDARPIVELACDVEAITAHLHPEGDVAHLFWSEPVADGSCAFPGLSVGAIVEASSDKPGARRLPVLAEGVAQAGLGRYLAVVRNGGCASYDASGNGALVVVK